MRYVPASQDGSGEKEHWAALERGADRVVEDWSVPPLIPCEFGYFGYIDGPRGQRIYEYKHLDSRRYIQLTLDGRVARYVPPTEGDRGLGRYVITRQSLKSAVLRLDMADWAGTRPYDRYCDGCQRLLDRRRGATRLRVVV